MKKVLMILFTVILAAGCKKDKEELAPFQVADYPIELVGEWMPIAYKWNDKWEYKQDTINRTIFNSNLSFVLYEDTGIRFGTWEITGYNFCRMLFEYSIPEDDMTSKISNTWSLISYKNDTLHVGVEFNIAGEQPYYRKQERLYKQVHN